MSFIGKIDGHFYSPGYCLMNAECSRVTTNFSPSLASVVTAADGSKHVPMGTVYPSNDSNAVGIVYEDVDVTNGAAPGSLITKGDIYMNRMPVEIASAAKTALEGLGFHFASESNVTRPDDDTESD